LILVGDVFLFFVEKIFHFILW